MSQQEKVPSLDCPVCATSHTPLQRQLKNGVYAGNCQNCGYFFKFRAVSDTADTVTFTVNGTSYTVGNEFNPATSLNEWMRSQRVSTGTKQCCLEGGCGVCNVTVKLLNPLSNTSQVFSVSSCLVQLYQCDGWEITTIEGLGNPKVGLHPIQQRMVQYNGSQCGFCTPGQIMNMYGLLQRYPTPTKQQVEDNSDATICRCTGYRPILDAMKSFAVDAPRHLPVKGTIDIEDLNPKVCQKSGQPCTGKCGPKKEECGSVVKRPVHIVAQRAQWFKPTSLEGLTSLLTQYRDANYRLVFGNSGYGIYKELGPWMFDVLIDIRGVSSLYGVKFSPTSVMLGANLSITNLLELFQSYSNDPTVSAYFPDFAAHTKQIGSHSIRNISSWAGNLMLKNKHPFFISDIFTMLETVGTKLFIVDANGGETESTLEDFIRTDMKGKVITAASLPTYTTGDVYIRTFRVAQRLQLDHGYVLAGFNFRLDKNDNFRVKVKPTMVFEGIWENTNHASRTEAFLTGKQLGDPLVLAGAMDQLEQEVVPIVDPVLATPQYRRTLACSLFYKFVLGVCSTLANDRYHSGSLPLYRPVSTATQSYGSRSDEYPLTKPMTKLDAAYQVCGETRYLEDEPLEQTELYAAFVLATKGNATIASIDASVALSMPGVYKFIKASDIPGTNSFSSPGSHAFQEELLCSGQVLYAGQPIGIIVANDMQIADTAASMVQVTYSNVQPPLTDFQEAIQQKSFYPDPPKIIVTGDPDQSISGSARRVTGTLQMGTQAHFQLETQAARCAPNDDGGMEVQATTQWIDKSQEVIARVLNIPQSSITVEVKRLGGAFGRGITRNFMVSGACALAAYIMQRPVRLRMNIHDQMKAIGKRFPYYAEYEIGFTDEGVVNGITTTVYADCGSSPNESGLSYMFPWITNAYNIQNWRYTPVNVKTHKAANTFCRAPGSVPIMFLMESMMEHVAKALNKDPNDVRKLNLYQKGDVTPSGMHLDYCIIGDMVNQLETSSDFAARKQQIQMFNQANRWIKRGISLVPTIFGMLWDNGTFNVYLTIYHGDGTIAIEHAGIECGQGINTKTAQVCAYELGVPMSLIRVKKPNSVCNSNSMTTGGSVTSEINCLGVVECCKMLKARMDPVRQEMGNPTWMELVTKCYDKGLDLSAHYYTHTYQGGPFRYNVYAAVVTECEVDILTGQNQIIRADISYDAGQSMNPELDVCQIEGGFIMGLGYHLTEKLKFDPVSGEVITDGTWEYKPPMPKDLPIDFRVSMLKNASNPLGCLSSKAVGEPPVVLSASALFAIKHAIEAARAEIGQDVYFTLNSPCLVEDAQTACKLAKTQFTFGQ